MSWCAALATVAFAWPVPSPAQAILSSGVERVVPAESFWRLTYENDFFTATDRFYTQGILLEVVHPRLHTRAFEKLLIAPKGSRRRYGLAFEDNGYTSSDLKQATIPVGDRPYAGTKQLRVFVFANDTASERTTSSSLTLGVIGPAAGGREIQTYLHRKTGNTIPMGWTHQIQNDLILNYDVSSEQLLHRLSANADVFGSAAVRVGTFHTAATFGTTLRVGRLPVSVPTHTPGRTSSRQNAVATRQPRSFFMYAKPQLQLVGYDATLQGGLLNRRSPYTISATDISRTVYRQQIGVVYQSATRYVELSHIYTSAGFRGGSAHRTGGISFGVMLTSRRSPSR
jgi:hypothetical protein